MVARIIVLYTALITGSLSAMNQPAPQEQIMQEAAPVQASQMDERILSPRHMRVARICCFYGSMYLLYRSVLGLPQPAPEIAVATIALVQHTPVVREGQRLCGRVANYHHDRDGL